MDELLKSIAEHVAFYGFRTEIVDNILRASHASRAYFWVIPSNGGVVFRTIFNTGPAAKAEPDDFHKFINDANQVAVIARYVEREEFLSIEAWFPNFYDKEIFATFFDRYLADIQAPIVNNRSAVTKFFPE